jgi:Predicted Rossmann fold nucleotide-binding protein involved in DNA uptake
MEDLFSISQLIQKHPLYRLHRDTIHVWYKELGDADCLDVQTLLALIKDRSSEIFEFLQKNFAQYKKQQEEVLLLRMKGVQFVCYGEELYPKSCYFMQEPPLTLSYLGSPAWLTQRSLAVVGSREPVSASISWMEKELVAFATSEQACIVSGGARGIDQKAHGIALRMKSPTIVVVPSGLGSLYPASLQEWTRYILETGGAIVSEYAYTQKMHKYLFHHRNRLIAGFGAATLLVEARRKSGTLITAHQTLQLGRSLGVVPGHPLDPNFGGSVDLLTEGAVLIRDAQDLSLFFRSELQEDFYLEAGLGEDEMLPH